MKLTKFPHACLRIEQDGGVLVVDPGVFSEPGDALRGADAVLITHEHADHVDVDALKAAARRELAVYAHADVAAQLTEVDAAVTAVAPGDSFTAAGMEVRVFGDRHAHIHEDVPDIPNNAYLIGGRVYYAGDAFSLPGVEVETLFVPIGAPWMKLAEAIDYVRAVAPQRAHPTHDAVLSTAGQSISDNWLTQRGGTSYSRLTPGTPTEL
ncbi:MAG TPA: MBL fold metallo-hydrolase [Mycobacteriales bacterium]|nr:MBL fold metallo-hydrolase [Mycobacteriales bacterium]